MKTLSEYVSWLNSMTTSELLKEFPGQFHTLNATESSAECVKKMLANDAILWRMVKDYNKKLLSTASLTQKNEFAIPAVSGSVHQMMAINTFKEMEKQLEILKKDVSFREYIGFEMCMKIFCQRYEKLIIVNSNDR